VTDYARLCAIESGVLVTAHRSDRRTRVFDAMGSSMRRVGFIVTAICAVLAALALAPAARADGSAPSGCVDGWHSPAGKTLDLGIHASPADGGTLATATITLNGTTVASRPLPADTPSCTGTDIQKAGVPLAFDTRSFADGTYHLVVTVADADGASAAIKDVPNFEIFNPPPGSSSATLTIGSGVPAPPPQVNPGGGVLGASAGACVKPKLSMRLSQKPLRIRKGVPVLVKGKRYRFTGRLTCLVDHRRVSAPKRTKIELRQIVHGKSHLKGHGTVRSHGKVVVRFSVPRSRTLEFRFITADKKVTRVRIKVRVVKVAAHRKHHKRHEKG
jgi:hypothetical protein